MQYTNSKQCLKLCENKYESFEIHLRSKLWKSKANRSYKISVSIHTHSFQEYFGKCM